MSDSAWRFEAPIPPSECARRLAGAKADRFAPYGLRADAPRGWVSDDRFALLYVPPGVRTPFVPMLEGRLFDQGSTTLIEARQRMPRAKEIFMWIWLGGMLAMFVAVGWLAIGAASDGGSLAPLGFIGFVGVFGASLALHSRYVLGPRSEATVASFIEHVCEARVVSRPDRDRATLTTT